MTGMTVCRGEEIHMKRPQGLSRLIGPAIFNNQDNYSWDTNKVFITADKTNIHKDNGRKNPSKRSVSVFTDEHFRTSKDSDLKLYSNEFNETWAPNS